MSNKRQARIENELIEKEVENNMSGTRITRRLTNNIIEFVDGKGYGNLSHSEGVKLLFERLAVYEDTKLSPAEIESQKEEIEKLQAKLEAKYVFINNGSEDQRWAIQEQQIAQIEFLQKVIGEKDMAMFKIADFLDSLSQLCDDKITKEQCRLGINLIKDATRPFSSRTQEKEPHAKTNEMDHGGAGVEK